MQVAPTNAAFNRDVTELSLQKSERMKPQRRRLHACTLANRPRGTARTRHRIYNCACAQAHAKQPETVL